MKGMAVTFVFLQIGLSSLKYEAKKVATINETFIS